MQEQVHLEQSAGRPTMRRFLACQNSILEEGKEGDRESERGARGRGGEGEYKREGEVPPKSETPQFVECAVCDHALITLQSQEETPKVVVYVEY